jgi:hypothetical protein
MPFNTQSRRHATLILVPAREGDIPHDASGEPTVVFREITSPTLFCGAKYDSCFPYDASENATEADSVFDPTGLIGDCQHPQSRSPTLRRRTRAPLVIGEQARRRSERYQKSAKAAKRIGRGM